MRHVPLRVVAALIACLIIASFLVSVLRTRENAKPAVSKMAVATTTIQSVALHDNFKKGVHTITGAIIVPDACTTASATASPAGSGSTTESINVAVAVPDDAGICLQIPSVIHFSTTLAAPSGLPMTATVNGVAATTTAL